MISLLVGGCISLPREQAPPFPESIPTAEFGNEAQEQLATHDSKQYRVSIVDAALPEGENGFYGYLLVTAHPPSPHLSSFARTCGIAFSGEPERFIEAVAPDGRPVELRSMQYPSEFYIGFRTFSFAQPWNEPVFENDNDRAVVQLCMWPVAGKLSPGKYRMRLRVPNVDDDESRAPTDVDVEWKLLEVNHQATRE